MSGSAHHALRELLGDALDHPLLTGEQERRLARRVARGDRAARERLVAHNLRLVAKVALGHATERHDVRDLFQAGVLGLLRACDGYDPARGTRFTTYAWPWVCVAVVEARRRDAAIVAPRLPPAVPVPPRIVESLHRPVDEDPDGDTVMMITADPDSPDPVEHADRALSRAAVVRLLAPLDPPRRTIALLRFIDDPEHPVSRAVIGERLGISRETVRKYERALRAQFEEHPALAGAAS
jgi:RNA polymerase sigma factor (sigma-70 family)